MNNNSSYKILFKYLNKHLAIVILSVILMVCFAISVCLIPMYVGKTIDVITDSTLLTENIIKIIIIIIISSISCYLGKILINRISFLLIQDIRNDLFNKIVNLPISYIDTHKQGDIVNRIIADSSTLSNSLIIILSQAFSGIATIAFTLVFMLRASLKLGLIILILTPLSLLISMFISKKTYKYFKKSAKLASEESSYINEVISREKVVSAFNYQTKSENKFTQIDDKFNKASLLATFYSSTVNPSTRFINNIIYAIAALLCALIVIKNENPAFTIGTMVTFLSYASEFGKPFNEISEVIAELQSTKVCVERINEIISQDNEIEIIDGSNITNIDNIEFNGVSFSYVENKKLIEHLDLKVPKGKKIAIVGPTGCGKTTLINLLMRFYDINKGDIKINDVSFNNITKRSLRKKCSMVLQETWIKSGTVYDNILLGKQNATKEEVINAATLSKADSFINKLPNGFDTYISNDSGILSEGERQLICISRAMLANSDFLILDEATSSLDSRTEIKIGEAFDTLTQNRTSIVIAHRLSTIKNADKIAVLKDGTIIEEGTHEELLNNKSFYYDLYMSQFAN